MGNDVKKIMEETTKEIVEAQTEHPKKKKKLGGFALYLLGSAVVTVGMAAVMPKMMDKMVIFTVPTVRRMLMEVIVKPLTR